MDPTAMPCDLAIFGEAHATCGASRTTWLRILGVAATGLALAGVALPLVPTVPFALLAAWAFARSSPELEARLLAHPRLGPSIRAWRERRAIPRRAKALAGLSVAASGTAIWATGPSISVAAAATLVLAAVAAWIGTRPIA